MDVYRRKRGLQRGNYKFLIICYLFRYNPIYLSESFRTLLIFSHVSPYLNVSKVKESTHAKIVVFGNRVAVSISPNV
jgi:hypothetical protein